MAVPVIEAIETAVAPGFGDATLTFARPTGTSEGELLLVHVAVRNGTSHTLPSGWTLLDETIHGGVMDYVAWKIATSSEPTSYYFANTVSSSDRASGALLRISGVEESTPINASAEASYNGDSAADESPSVTTTVSDCLLIVTQGHNVDPMTSTVPSGTTEEWKIGQAGQVLSHGASEEIASSGATGVRTWTITGFADCFILRSIAIAPAGGGGIVSVFMQHYRRMRG